MKFGLPPVIDKDCNTLILGALPGDKSIEQKQYYANPNNQFWRIVFAAFDEKPANVFCKDRL